MLLTAAAERGDNLNAITQALLRLLDHYGAAGLEVAIGEALARDVPIPHAVRQCLERRRQERELPPPVAVSFPADPRISRIVIRPHDLSTYDLDKEAPDGDA